MSRQGIEHFVKNRWVMLIVALWILLIALVHILDLREFRWESQVMLTKALDLVDFGKMPRQGDYIQGDFRMGPLGPILTSLPLHISRDPRLHYWLLSILWIIAAAIFFVAARYLFPDGKVKWIITANFAYVMFASYTPLVLEDDFFLPVLFALYFYLLVMMNRRRLWAHALAGLVIAVMSHLHFTAMLLVVPTLVLPFARKDPWGALYSSLGIAIAFLTHRTMLSMIWMRLLAHETIVRTTEAMTSNFGPAVYFSYLGQCLFFSLTGMFGLATLIYGIVAIVQSKKIFERFSSEMFPLLVATYSYLIAGMLVLPAVYGLTQKIYEYYYRPALLFWCVVIGCWFQMRFEQPDQYQKSKWLRNALAIFLVLLAAQTVAGFVIDNIRSGPDVHPRLRDHLDLSDRLIGQMEQEKTATGFDVSRPYFYDNYNQRWMSPNFVGSTMPLIRCKRPDLAGKLSSGAPVAYPVFIIEEKKSKDHPIPNQIHPGKEKIESYNRGRLLFSIYRSTQ